MYEKYERANGDFLIIDTITGEIINYYKDGNFTDDYKGMKTKNLVDHLLARTVEEYKKLVFAGYEPFRLVAKK